MNVIDFCIIVGLCILFVYTRGHGFIESFFKTIGLIVGYCFAIWLAARLAGQMPSDLRKGILTLIFIGTFCFLGLLLGRYSYALLGDRLHPPEFFKADRWLSLPYRILVSITAVVILSQTFIYIPVLGLQFVSQGSTIMMLTNRFAPSTPLQSQAGKIDPSQFLKLHLAYDYVALTYNNIHNGGKFQAVIDSAAASVVKISGKSCVGLGFGSGFMVGENLVLTNAHVVTGASTIYISDHSGSYPATPILINYDKDIAILFSKFISDPPLTLSAKKAPIGTAAIMVGYPGGGDLQMLAAKVIDDNTFISRNTKLTSQDIIELDNPTQPGNSGGPVFDLDGKVIGVVSAGRTTTFAIDSQLAGAITNEAKHKLIPTRTDFCDVGIRYY